MNKAMTARTHTMNGNPRSPSFLSLRTKLVLFISLVIVGTCSGLSWFFVQQQSESMKNALMKTGRILVNNLAHQSRYSLITQDTNSLQQILEGVLSVEDVVYVVASGPQGQPLVHQTKGMLTNSSQFIRSADEPLFPNPVLAQQLLTTTTPTPTINTFTTKSQNFRIVSNRGKAGSVPTKITQRGETIYDFALPVQRQTSTLSFLGPLSLEQHEVTKETTAQDPSPTVYGVIQVGLTNAHLLQSLNSMIWNVAVITIMIIVIGIVSATVLANQTITPLRRLAGVAGQIASGDLSVSVVPGNERRGWSINDEH